MIPNYKTFKFANFHLHTSLPNTYCITISLIRQTGCDVKLGMKQFDHNYKMCCVRIYKAFCIAYEWQTSELSYYCCLFFIFIMVYCSAVGCSSNTSGKDPYGKKGIYVHKFSDKIFNFHIMTPPTFLHPPAIVNDRSLK